MTIDWNDSKKRKALRKALQAVYPSLKALQLFVDEELDENLATIAGPGNLQVTAYDLVVWGKAKGRLDKIYAAFCAENSNNPLIAELQQDLLISTTLTHILDTEWSELFAAFRTEDCGTILTGFFAGFEQVFTSSFSDVRPDEPLTDSARVQDLLVTYDRPELAVRFVECAIAQIQTLAGNNARDLKPLQQWRDRIAKKFEIAPRVADMGDQPLCYGYLLIAIDASHGDENLMIYPELRVTGKESAISLNISTTPRSIDQLLIDLPQWIKEAEHQLFKENYNLEDGEVVLELFLPSSYLGRDMDNWKIKDDDDDLISLMSHRRFVLRSWDRIHDRTIQHGLKKRWHVLQNSDRETICQLFHLQEQPPNNELIPLLKDQDDRIGLKLVSPLPSGSSERNKIFKIFKKVPIPLILWSCNPDISGKDVLEPAFNEILETSRLEHFAHLARQWRHRRNQSSIAKPIRLLCDCPDRVPTNVPKDEDTDALVAA